MEYMVAAYTDTGLQKETNQDSICIRRAEIPGVGEVIMAVVCDGMGGLQKGEVASAACVKAFGKWFDHNLPGMQGICENGFQMVRSQWTQMLAEVHQDLIAYAARTHTQLGTTVAAILTYADRYLVVNIGDSRVYERKQTLRQLTQDHSLVAREIAVGRITEEESRHHPQRNVLLQCLGAGESAVPAFYEGKVQGDALYLLCSDGLVHEVSSTEMEDLLQSTYLPSKDSLSEVLTRITELCKERGETDNITSILIKSNESNYVPSNKGGWKGFLRKLGRSGTQEKEPAILLETALFIHAEEPVDLR